MSTPSSRSKSRRRANAGGGAAEQPSRSHSPLSPAVSHGGSALVFRVLEVDPHHGDYGATLWMPSASMLSASLSASQLVSVSMCLEHLNDALDTSQVENLEERCNMHFGVVLEKSLEELGSLCVIASAWPCSKLKGGVRISKQLACALCCSQALPVVCVKAVTGAGLNWCKGLRLPSIEVKEMDVQECQELVVRHCTAKAKDNQGDMLESLSAATDTPECQVLVSNKSEASPQESKTRAELSKRKVDMSSSSKNNQATDSKKLGKNASQILSQSKEQLDVSSVLRDKDGRAVKLLERLAGRLLSGRYLLKGNLFAITVCGQDLLFQVVNAIRPLSARSLVSDGGRSNGTEKKEPALDKIQMPTLFLVGKTTQVKLELSVPAADSTQMNVNAAGDGAAGVPYKQIEYSALGGLSEQILTLKEVINFSLLQPERLLRLAVAPWRTSLWASWHREDISCPCFCHRGWY